MKNKLFIYVLLLALSVPILSPWGTIAYFMINRAYIEKVLCKNKDNKELNCRGNCFLTQKLAKHYETSETQEQENMKPVVWSPLYYAEVEPFHIQIQTRLFRVNNRIMNPCFNYPQILPDIFHPPRRII